jgi:hypothetical protein
LLVLWKEYSRISHFCEDVNLYEERGSCLIAAVTLSHALKRRSFLGQPTHW